MSPTHTSCFRKILTPLFDLYYVLEIITFGNHNGPDAGPLTLLGPYIVSLVNANGPTGVCIDINRLHHDINSLDINTDIFDVENEALCKF